MNIKKILKIIALIIFLFLLCVIIYYRYLFIVDLKITTFSQKTGINLGYKAYFKGKDVTNEVMADEGTFDGKVGEYEVTFTYWNNDKKCSETKKYQ